MHPLMLGVGELVAVVQQVAQAGQRALTHIGERIRASPVVHANATGWRQDGHNGYVWTCSIPTEWLSVYGRRDKGLVDAVLGDQCAGVLVSDVYAAGDQCAGEHQRCWVHWLRGIHDLKLAHPTNTAVWAWADPDMAEGELLASPAPMAWVGHLM